MSDGGEGATASERGTKKRTLLLGEIKIIFNILWQGIVKIGWYRKFTFHYPKNNAVTFLHCHLLFATIDKFTQIVNNGILLIFKMS